MDWSSVGWLVMTMAQAGVTQPAPAPAFEGSAELTFVGTSGNSETQSLGAGTVLMFRPGRWTITNKAAMVRNEDHGTVHAQSLSISTQGGREMTPRLSLVAGHAYARDRFAGIKHRNSIDAGLTVDAITTNRHSLVLEGRAGYASEQRLTGADVSSSIGSTAALYTLKISETASFETEARAVFSLEDGRDQRVTNVASLTAQLNSRFSLKATHTTRWVRRPAPGFKTTDTITAVALVAKF